MNAKHGMEYWHEVERQRNELLEALEGLRAQLLAHVKLDVKKHYSLMVAEAVAGSTIAKAKGEQ